MAPPADPRRQGGNFWASLAGGEAVAPPVPLIRLSSADSVTMVGGGDADDVWPEAEALLDRTLAVAVDELGRRLS